jgi:hypothetical protein|tara:strand:+ start:156 stop:434 length:279 start_codon:yes stop_codon:yes gene_type:complete
MKIKKLSEETEFTVSIRSLIAFAIAMTTLIGVWFEIKYDIQEAKILPTAVIGRAEYDIKIHDMEDEIKDMKEQFRIFGEHFLHGDFERWDGH